LNVRLEDHLFEARWSGRYPNSCVVCGKVPEAHAVVDPDSQFNGAAVRPRNLKLEAQLTDLAARAAGRFTASGDGDDRGLLALAQSRALPGGVRENLEAVREIGEEAADALNYANWGIEKVYEDFLAGDHDAADTYDRLMRFSSRLVDAWHELHTRSV
jgi:hypothetical protein